MTKERIKLGLSIFIVAVLLGASLFLWFMIYKDSAKNSSTKKSDITDNCDQSLGNCNNKAENIPASSKSEEVITNSSVSNDTKSYSSDLQNSVTENSNNIETPVISPIKNAIQPAVNTINKPEIKKVETTTTAQAIGNADDGKEKETDDSITVETESDD